LSFARSAVGRWLFADQTCCMMLMFTSCWNLGNHHA
jgi:hypothetical protein